VARPGESALDETTRGETMATYIALIDYTDKGVEAIQDSPMRSEAFIAQAAEAGAQVRDVYWTFGGHDGVLILDAPDDETAAQLFLSLGKTGAVRTQTLRAYDRQGFQAILNDLD
jgi:uncharacterized protein with GYD domain